MTAQEAKQRTDEINYGKHSHMFQLIDEKIEESISRGDYSKNITKSLIGCELTSEVRKVISKHYTDLGYEFIDDISSVLDPIIISKISWGNSNERKGELLENFIDKEREMTFKLLQRVSDILCGKDIDGIDECILIGWSLDEINQLCKDFHDWNGDPEYYEEGVFSLKLWSLMMYLVDKLKNSQSCLS